MGFGLCFLMIAFWWGVEKVLILFWMSINPRLELTDVQRIIHKLFNLINFLANSSEQQFFSLLKKLKIQKFKSLFTNLKFFVFQNLFFLDIISCHVINVLQVYNSKLCVQLVLSLKNIQKVLKFAMFLT